MEINVGKVVAGSYNEGDLIVNGTDLAETNTLEVLEDDQGGALRAAFSSIEGVTATLKEDKTLEIEFSSALLILGARTEGRPCVLELLAAGEY